MISSSNGINLPSQVELRHLQAFLAVAERRSFGKAAQAIGYTQGAVSQQVAALEKAVGLDLFERPGGPRPIELTEAGRLLLGHAQAVIDRLHLAAADLAGLQAGTRGRLAVGAFQSVSVRLLPLVVQRLAAERPDLELVLSETDNRELLEGLERRTLDVIFVDTLPPAHSHAQRTIMVDSFVAVLPAGSHPDGVPIPMDQLAAMPLIGQVADDYCQIRQTAGFQAHGYDPDVVFRTGDNAAVQAMVRAGRGAAVLPHLAVDLHDPGVVVVPIDPPIPPREITLVWREHTAVDAAVERFVELAIEAADELSRQLGAHRPA